MLWTVAFGVWIAAMYLLLKPGITAKRPLARAVFIGVVIFGINIFLNDMFMPIPFELKIWEMGTFSYLDLIVRASVDIIFVCTGVHLCEKVLASSNSKAGKASKETIA
jgi:hypothetical protein